MRSRTFAALVVMGILAWSCVSTNGSALRGASGPVAWDIVDVRQRLGSGEIRWLYALVLKNTGGRSIGFERIERTVTGADVIGSSEAHRWERRLDPGSEIRLDLQDGIVLQPLGGPAGTFGSSMRGIDQMTVVYRLHGRDDAGNPVAVEVLVRLHPGLGRRE